MIVCPILPKHHTVDIWKMQSEGFGAMVLRQHLRKSREYRDAINECQKRKNIYCVLDNGAAEGYYAELDLVVQYACELQCHHFVMPDIYWTNENAAKQTMKLIGEAKSRVENEGIISRAMCVLNSFNVDENLDNMQKLMNDGFSVFAVPMLPNRPAVIEAIRSNLDSLKANGLKYIHALGMLSPIEISMYEGVCDSIDTSMFAKYQLYKPEAIVPHLVKNEPYTKYESRDDEFFQREVTDNDICVIEETINRFRR